MSQNQTTTVTIFDYATGDAIRQADVSNAILEAYDAHEIGQWRVRSEGDRTMTLTYEFRYEINGTSGTKMVSAETEESAVEQFLDIWRDYGSEPPASWWIVGRWSVQN